MKNSIMIAALTILFSINANAQQQEPVQKKNKAKTEKSCSAEEKKSCGSESKSEKKAGCCAAKKGTETKS
jgi:hypothetical protein